MSQKVRKIVVLGSRSVGKSTLINQFVNEFYADAYYPTIENTYRKNIRYKGQDFECEILDTAGQDEFTPVNAKYAVGVQGYILVYSIASRSSFEMTKIVRDKILSFTGSGYVPVVLVGNKSDLHSQREVTAEEAADLARSWNCEAVESSAKNNDNIAKIFDKMIIAIEHSLNPPAEARGSCVIF
ncbi:GTP-binding protein [Tieghemiomyces parasiticus]|uniref:GTP-binding protein n=1 Tax=Tieghemiomyces parasiticus TaxID=78921 RepID=A0A9W8ALD1_9FUNG|nr:GTP-binding protein [Tieghemiomyces parasiticus]KAJ1930409.1 GTP-binding protein [Tieghemiomyces parasiticus]